MQRKFAGPEKPEKSLSRDKPRIHTHTSSALPALLVDESVNR